MRKENTMLVVALLAVLLFVSNASATVIADYHGYEDADLGRVVDDDLAPHVTGTLGGSVGVLGDATKATYVAAPSTYEGNRAVSLKMPVTPPETNYLYAWNKVNGDLGGNQMYWYDMRLYVPHNGLSNAQNAYNGLTVGLKYKGDSSGTGAGNICFYDNGTVVYNMGGGGPGGGLVYNQTYDRWFRITIGYNPDASGDGLATNDRELEIWVDGVKALNKISYTDTNPFDTIGAFFPNYYMIGQEIMRTGDPT